MTSLSLSKKRNFYFLYTLLFLVCAALCFWQFYLNGKSFVWKNDGLYQHYNSFIYLGTYVREFFRTLVTEHKFVLPMWENSIGYGGDIFTTLSYYVFGDPFALISVITPTRFAEWGYAFSIVLRMFAAGIAFCAYAKKMKCSRWASLCGSVVYVFSVFALFAAVRHPYFANPMIYLPLLFLGIEKVMRNENPLMLILAVFVAAVSNFYFFYMLAILMVIYALVRLLSIYRIKEWKPITINLLKIAVFSAIGIMMAAVLFLPNCMAFLGNNRVSGIYEFGILYRYTQYKRFFTAFVGVDSSNWTYTGMAPFAYIGAVAYLLNGGKRNWTLKMTAVFLLFLAFPFFGHVFNGFGYVCNRWVFAWAFLISFMFVKGLPILQEGLSKKQRVLISLAGVLYTLVCASLKVNGKEAVIAGCVLLLIGVTFMCICPDIPEIRLKKHTFKRQSVFRVCAFTLAVLCVATQAKYMYSKETKTYITEFHDRRTPAKTLNKRRTLAVKKTSKSENGGFWRVENSRYQNEQLNYPLTLGVSSTKLYWSLINPNIQEYLQLTSAGNELNYKLHGLDSRAMLLPAACAQYFITDTSEHNIATVPYNYSYVSKTKSKSDGKTYRLYSAQNILPFGYTFDSTMSFAEFYKLSFAKRQQAMLQTAIIDDGEKTKLSTKTLSFSDAALPYTVECGSGVTKNGNKITVSKANATMKLYFNGTANKELYVQINGVNFENERYYKKKFSDDYNNAKGFSEKLNILNAKLKFNPSTRCNITASCGKTSNFLTYFSNKDMYTVGRNNYMLNLYYSKNARNVITLKFGEIGCYSFDDISVIEQPLNELDNSINALKKECLENVSFKTNNITGDITVNDNKLLCLSLPYSSGWKAYVDGKEAKLLRTNIMYSGIELESGTHKIELKYETPYLKIGFVISVIGFAAAVVTTIIYKKRRVKQ